MRAKYQGTFDGNGKTISNLYINATSVNIGTFPQFSIVFSLFSIIFAEEQNLRRYAAKYHILPCIIRLYVIIDYLLLSLLDTTLQMTKIISC